MKVKKLRKLAILVMAVVFLCSFSINASAATQPLGEGIIKPITPRWANTSGVGAGLSFSGTTAKCTASIDGYSGTTKITATYELQRKSGTTFTTIKSWTASASDEYLDWGDNYTVTSGYTYRLYVTAKVTRNGTTETATGWVEGVLK